MKHNEAHYEENENFNLPSGVLFFALAFCGQ
jgi:hypothetical protein